VIASAHEYQVTLEAAQRLEAALAEADCELTDLVPRHQQLMRAAIESQLHGLRADIAAYETRTPVPPAPRIG